ncbi:predicted protein, partial [Arabidopsis lyrata subsp. lyrata]
MLRSRRSRSRHGAQACAVMSAVLLLASVSLLYTRLSLFSSHSPIHLRSGSSEDAVLFPDSLLVSDSDVETTGGGGRGSTTSTEDRIDEHDDAIEDDGGSNEEDENQDAEQEQEVDLNRNKGGASSSSSSSSGFYFDHNKDDGRHGEIKRGERKTLDDDKKIERKEQTNTKFEGKLDEVTEHYFAYPAIKDEKSQQDESFKKILNESLTFHFWNSVTSSLIPEPESLVALISSDHESSDLSLPPSPWVSFLANGKTYEH